MLRKTRIACTQHLLRAAALAKSAELREHAVNSGVLAVETSTFSDERARRDCRRRRRTAGEKRGKGGGLRRRGQRRSANEIDKVERREALARRVVESEANEERRTSRQRRGGGDANRRARGDRAVSGERQQAHGIAAAGRTHEHVRVRTATLRGARRLLAIGPAGAKQVDDSVVPHLPAGDG